MAKKKASATPARKKKTTRPGKATQQAPRQAKKSSAQSSASPKRSGSASQKSAPLPRVGSKVQWRSLPGLVTGKVVAILRKDSTLNGKKIKASPEAPRIRLLSDHGKECVHKPESVQPAN